MLAYLWDVLRNRCAFRVIISAEKRLSERMTWKDASRIRKACHLPAALVHDPT